jgi:hypothetical protein
MKKLLFGMMILGLIGAVSVRASDSGELWEVVSRMQLPGMPFAMWSSTDTVCIEAGKERNPDKVIPKNLRDQNCRFDGINISGNKSSWAMNCAGTSPATGAGEMTLDEGTFIAKSLMQSMGASFTMAYEGKRVGTCQTK